jgi:hypothetical protein
MGLAWGHVAVQRMLAPGGTDFSITQGGTVAPTIATLRPLNPPPSTAPAVDSAAVAPLRQELEMLRRR